MCVLVTVQGSGPSTRPRTENIFNYQKEGSQSWKPGVMTLPEALSYDELDSIPVFIYKS